MNKKANLKKLQLPSVSTNLNGNSKSTGISNYFVPIVDDSEKNFANTENQTCSNIISSENVRSTHSRLDKIEKIDSKNENVTEKPRRSTRNKLKYFLKETKNVVSHSENDDEFEIPTKIIKKAPKKKSAKLKGAFLKNEEVFSNIVAKHCFKEYVNPEELQIALALSKSEIKVNKNHDVSQTEFYFESNKNVNLSKDVKNVLQQFGFQTGSKKIDNNISSIFPSKKKSKWNQKLTPLTLRNPVKQEERLNQKVERFMNLQSRNYKVNVSQASNFELKLTSKLLNKLHATNTILNRLESESDAKNEVELYYVLEIIEPTKTNIGHLLKDFKKIQGRESSPVRSVYNKCEKESVDADTENNSYSDTESNCVTSELNPFDSPVVNKLKLNNLVENLNTSENQALTPCTSPRSFHKIDSPDLFSDSDNEREIERNLNVCLKKFPIKNLTNVAVSSNSIYKRQPAETDLDITIYEKFSSDEVKTSDDKENLSSCCFLTVDLTQTDDENSSQSKKLNSTQELANEKKTKRDCSSKSMELEEVSVDNSEIVEVSEILDIQSVKNVLDKVAVIDSQLKFEKSRELAKVSGQKSVGLKFTCDNDNFIKLSDDTVEQVKRSNHHREHLENSSSLQQLEPYKTKSGLKEGKEMKNLSSFIPSRLLQNESETKNDCNFKLIESKQLDKDSHFCKNEDSDLIELSDDEVNCSTEQTKKANNTCLHRLKSFETNHKTIENELIKNTTVSLENNFLKEPLNSESELKDDKQIMSNSLKNYFRKEAENVCNLNSKESKEFNIDTNRKAVGLSSSYNYMEETDDLIEISDDEVNFSLEQAEIENHQSEYSKNKDTNNSDLQQLDSYKSNYKIKDNILSKNTSVSIETNLTKQIIDICSEIKDDEKMKNMSNLIAPRTIENTNKETKGIDYNINFEKSEQLVVESINRSVGINSNYDCIKENDNFIELSDDDVDDLKQQSKNENMYTSNSQLQQLVSNKTKSNLNEGEEKAITSNSIKNDFGKENEFDCNLKSQESKEFNIDSSHKIIEISSSNGFIAENDNFIDLSDDVDYSIPSKESKIEELKEPTIDSIPKSIGSSDDCLNQNDNLIKRLDDKAVQEHQDEQFKNNDTNSSYFQQFEHYETKSDLKENKIISSSLKNYFGKEDEIDCNLKSRESKEFNMNSSHKSIGLSSSYGSKEEYDNFIELSDDEVNYSIRQVEKENHQSEYFENKDGNSSFLQQLEFFESNYINDNEFINEPGHRESEFKDEELNIMSSSIKNYFKNQAENACDSISQQSDEFNLGLSHKSVELSSSYSCMEENDNFMELSDDEVNYSIRQVERANQQSEYFNNKNTNNSFLQQLETKSKIKGNKQMKSASNSIENYFSKVTQRENFSKKRKSEELVIGSSFKKFDSSSFNKYINEHDSFDDEVYHFGELKTEKRKSIINEKKTNKLVSGGIKENSSSLKIANHQANPKSIDEEPKKKSKYRKTLSTSFLEDKKSLPSGSLYPKCTSFVENDHDDPISDFDEIDKLIYGSPNKNKKKIPKSLNKLLTGNLQLNFREEEKNDNDASPQEFTHNGQVYLVQTNINSKKPDYPRMNSPTRLKELSNFGLKPLERKQAVIMLEYIYNQTHPIIVESNSVKKNVTENVNSAQSKNDVKIQLSSNKFQLTDCSRNLLLEDNVLPEMPNENYIFQTNLSKKIYTAPIPLHLAWYNLINSNKLLWEAILNFDPIDLREIFTFFKKLGMIYNPKDLKKFLDSRGIFFTYDLNDNASRK